MIIFKETFPKYPNKLKIIEYIEIDYKSVSDTNSYIFRNGREDY